MRTPDELWREWLRARAENLPVSAKAHAETLLDIIIERGDEPHWRSNARRKFMNWCDDEGLLIRGGTSRRQVHEAADSHKR